MARKQVFIIALIVCLITSPFASMVYAVNGSATITLGTLFALPLCDLPTIPTLQPPNGQNLVLFPIASVEDAPHFDLLLGLDSIPTMDHQPSFTLRQTQAWR